MIKLEKTLNKGITRRSFINRTVASSVAVGAGLTMTGTASAKGKRGGVLRLASNGSSTTANFDPATSGSNWTFILWNTVYNRLTYVNNNNELEGELATDWNVSNGGLSWVVNLRKGVQFHDGSEFTSADAVWSLMRHIGSNSKSGAKGQMGAWKEVKATGKYQIVIHLKTPDSDTPYVLNQTRLPMTKAGTSEWNMPNGTGPYIATSHNLGVKFKGKRNENYFKSDAAYFDAVELIAINDDTSRINALISGSVDVIREVPFELGKVIEQHRNYNLVRSDVGQYLCNDMQCKTGFTKDPNARLALKYATDRQAIVDLALNGYGSIANDHPIHKSDTLFDGSHKQRQFDPDKATYYWKKTGIGKTVIEYDTSASIYTGAVKHASILQQSAKKAGINLKINKRPADGYWSNIWGKKAYVANYWGRRPTAGTTFANAYTSTASGNKTGWGDEKFDKLLINLQKETNDSVRKEIVGDMQRIVSDKGGVGIPVFFAVLDAGSKKVKGLDSHGIFGLNNYRIAEKGWFE